METGLSYTSTTIVDHTNTAISLGSGDMAVLATPSMIALMENAAMKAVAPSLPEGSTTVGAMMQSTHVRPTAPGHEVKATAVLREVDGRKLTFDVKAEDENGLIGEGKHVRYIVDREKFLSKLK